MNLVFAGKGCDAGMKTFNLAGELRGFFLINVTELGYIEV